MHPGSERHIDLVHVDRRTGSAPLQLDVSPRPTGDQDVLDPGTYELSTEIRARNADARSYVIAISWDGAAVGMDAIWDHLRIEPPRKVR